MQFLPNSIIYFHFIFQLVKNDMIGINFLLFAYLKNSSWSHHI